VKDKDLEKLAERLIAEVQKRFGKKVCSPLDFQCGNCQAQALIGYLNWFIDTLDLPPKKRKSRLITYAKKQ